MAKARRSFSEKKKRAIVAQVAELGVQGTLDKFKLSDSVLARWRKRYGNGAAQPARADRGKPAQAGKLKAENERLRNLLLDIMLGKRPELVGAIK